MTPADQGIQAAKQDAMAEKFDLPEFFSYLYARWQDESEYEDFAEYFEALRKRLPGGATLDSMTKRPFRAVYTLSDGTRKWIKATSRQVTWGGFIKKTA